MFKHDYVSIVCTYICMYTQYTSYQVLIVLSPVSDYSLQSRDVLFINTEQMVEKTTIVVKINNDDIKEGVPESFNLILYSYVPTTNVVFTIEEMTVVIIDDD